MDQPNSKQKDARRINLDRELLKAIKTWKISDLGYRMRNNKFKFLQAKTPEIEEKSPGSKTSKNGQDIETKETF